MQPTKLFTWSGVIALVVGPTAVLAQYVVTPLGAEMTTSEAIQQAAENHTAMGWALALDVPSMLVIPAVLFAGYLARSRTSVLGGLATGLCLVPAIGGVVLFAFDALVFEAAVQPDPQAATSLADAFINNAMVVGLTVTYLLTHLVGFILLGVALARQKAVPLWAAGALGLWPVLEMAGYAAGMKPLAGVGYALLLVGYAACAQRLLASSPAPVTTGVAAESPSLA